jgi:hypothetical protein
MFLVLFYSFNTVLLKKRFSNYWFNISGNAWVRHMLLVVAISGISGNRRFQR